MLNRYPIADNHDYKSDDDKPRKTYSYCLRFEDEYTEETGEVVAKNMDEARLYLKVQYSVTDLPVNLRLWEKKADEVSGEQDGSSKIRYVKHILAEHYKWLEGKDGHRADLHNLNLSGVDLSKMNLSHAYMAEADLTGANLEKSRLFYAVHMLVLWNEKYLAPRVHSLVGVLVKYY